nr:hypothetical protein Iba_chr10aCG7000 [Ipomoea batatas]
MNCWFGVKSPASLQMTAEAFLSASRKWPREEPAMEVVAAFILAVTASVLSFEHSENNHILHLLLFLFPRDRGSAALPLVDLLENSKMLEMPRRLPRAMLLSWKKEPVD